MLDSMSTDAALDTADTRNSAVIEGQPEISCDPFLASFYRQVARIAAIGVVIVASVVLLGCFTDTPILTSFDPNWARMKVNTAVLSLLLGITLYLLSAPHRLSRQAEL